MMGTVLCLGSRCCEVLYEMWMTSRTIILGATKPTAQPVHVQMET